MADKPATTRIGILGDLNIFNAAEQRSRLLEALGAGKVVDV